MGPVKESDIKRQIIEYLHYQGVFCWVNSTTGIYDPKRGIFRKLTGRGMRRGVSDILGIYKGRFLAIEVKTKKGRLSPEQAVFLREVQENGGIGFMATDLGEVIKLLDLSTTELGRR